MSRLSREQHIEPADKQLAELKPCVAFVDRFRENLLTQWAADAASRTVYNFESELARCNLVQNLVQAAGSISYRTYREIIGLLKVFREADLS